MILLNKPRRLLHIRGYVLVTFHPVAPKQAPGLVNFSQLTCYRFLGLIPLPMGVSNDLGSRVVLSLKSRLSGCHDLTELLDNCFATLLHRFSLAGIRYGSLLPFTFFQPSKECRAGALTRLSTFRP